MTLAETLARKVLDAMNAGDVEAVGPLVAEDFVDHGAPPWAPQGRAGYIQILGYVTRALRITYEVDDVVAAGDKVAIRATAHGVNAVDMLGFAPTGKPYAMRTMHLYRESGGVLVEHWGVRDEIGMLWQVGALPPPRPVGFGLPAGAPLGD
ncbi:ester cyclase [Asanoa sp. NPDC049573]|uniref:ester cyclase n=1 Tax=Asanoa sp. NPDC049573 TaxID=3155396 RepID=UPI00341A0DB7